MCLSVPSTVISVSGEGMSRTAIVDVGGTRREVSVMMVPGVDVGDHVLIHSGYAIRRLDPDVIDDIHDAIDDVVVTEAQRGSRSST